MTYHCKLIEVSLPLGAILFSQRAGDIQHGQTSTYHLWWARRPLEAAWAVNFAQMVIDPSENEPDFGVTSINYNFTELLARAGEPF
jgi:putative DNA methylase